jgi:chromosome segregation ATPase
MDPGAANLAATPLAPDAFAAAPEGITPTPVTSNQTEVWKEMQTEEKTPQTAYRAMDPASGNLLDNLLYLRDERQRMQAERGELTRRIKSLDEEESSIKADLQKLILAEGDGAAESASGNLLDKLMDIRTERQQLKNQVNELVGTAKKVDEEKTKIKTQLQKIVAMDDVSTGRPAEPNNPLDKLLYLRNERQKLQLKLNEMIEQINSLKEDESKTEEQLNKVITKQRYRVEAPVASAGSAKSEVAPAPAPAPKAAAIQKEEPKKASSRAKVEVEKKKA